MKIVALTGGIGSGKTTVAKMFKDLGVPVYNSDNEAKALMVSSKELRKAIKALLGAEAYNGKTLNREYIAKKVFGDKGLLGQLNKIVHPAVREDFLRWAAKQSTPYVIQESAIVFENGQQDFYDKIILVTAPEEVRLARVMERDKVSKSEIRARMGNQLNDTVKIGLSDYVIENISLNETRSKVNETHKRILGQGGFEQF
ncbi:dephospho-CoA kinase [Maribacter polysaccharolyticus]|uniref:dephospho-CoA kinase n=1 Tax=Maribacter polysaccharolyticus TaxID=3020831 RepID=UPI00237F2C44|nr:dephospho-CoA kinase [Maribacter polysaccharolyticus]MDE3740651.1 dephospho-CoA kinase [Maribacter polysaccharolyticus]